MLIIAIKQRIKKHAQNIFFFFTFIIFTHLEGNINKSQITYLMQAGEVEKSISLYFRYKKELGKEDFEVLQQMAFILLEQGARSQDTQTQLLSIYGSGIASASSSLDILEAGIKSSHPETQIAAIQFLGAMQDDRSDELLVKAMSSEFFFARMEAAYYLAKRKHKTSVGQIESLMYRVPAQARFFFPQFFALIGTSDAIAILRHLMEDKISSVRVEALLSAAKFGRDDLLPIIRMNITHLNVAEQEAAAFAVGVLKDSKSLKKLQKLYTSSPINVQLAAARSLYVLGNAEAKNFLIKKALEEDIFAIIALADITEGKDVLATLCHHPDLIIRMNAALSLLQHHDSRCKVALSEILMRDTRDMGFMPQMSLGKTLLAFKPIFSTSQQDMTFFDIRAATLAIRQQVLLNALHLPESDFLSLANLIFESGQTDLISTLVTLLENLQTPNAIELLIKKSSQAGMPLIRAYCNLALYRMGKEGPYGMYLQEWIDKNKNSELIRFRPLVPIDKRLHNSLYELTPEDNSRLLIEAYQTLAEKQGEKSIEILLEAMRSGNQKNLCVLAGLLLKTLQ